jgi:hypothetical protein
MSDRKSGRREGLVFPKGTTVFEESLVVQSS